MGHKPVGKQKTKSKVQLKQSKRRNERPLTQVTPGDESGDDFLQPDADRQPCRGEDKKTLHNDRTGTDCLPRCTASDKTRVIQTGRAENERTTESCRGCCGRIRRWRDIETDGDEKKPTKTSDQHEGRGRKREEKRREEKKRKETTAQGDVMGWQPGRRRKGSVDDEAHQQEQNPSERECQPSWHD